MIDWTRLKNDGNYREHVLVTIQATPQGREWLSRFVGSFDDLPFDERVRLRYILNVPKWIDGTANQPTVMGFLPLFARLGMWVARSPLKGIISRGLTYGSVAITAAWTALKAGTVGGNIAAVAALFFASDYVLSKLQGHKPEVEKLYQAGRQVGGAAVDSSTILIKVLPYLLIGGLIILATTAMKGPVQNGKA